MTTDRNTDLRIEDLLTAALRNAAPADAPDALVDDVVGAARATRRLPRWLALVAESPMGRPSAVVVGSPMARLASIALALLLVGVLSGMALIAGGWLPHQDATVVLPAVSSAPSSLAPTPRPSVPAPTSSADRLVAYTVQEQLHDGRCATQTDFTCRISRIWIATAGGLHPHPLFGDPQTGNVLGWSPDGSSLLYENAGIGAAIIDPANPTNADGQLQERVVCPSPCDAYNRYFSWSPDGKRLALMHGTFANATTTWISILDLDGNTVSDLRSTSSTNRSQECSKTTTCEGTADVPRWSPDGKHLVFGRQEMSPEPGAPWTSAAIYTVDVDGSNLRRITPPGLVAIDASWSPDGSTLAFVGIDMVVNASHTSVVDMRTDIYTIGVDGANLDRLTNDGTSYLPRWTAAGRLTYHDGNDNWIVNADGRAPNALGPDLLALTAAGCMVCIYPPAAEGGGKPAYWQPVR